MSAIKLAFAQEWEEKRRQNIEKMNEEMEKIAEYERGQRVCSSKPLYLLLCLLMKNWHALLFNICTCLLRLMVKRTPSGTFWMIQGAVDQYLRWIAKREVVDMSATGVDWILKMLRLELMQIKNGRLGSLLYFHRRLIDVVIWDSL